MSQPFTEEAVVKECMSFLNNCDKPACNCNAGVRMCKHTPCIGTVDDMEKLINAGYAKNLMLDWWVGEGSGKRALTAITGTDKSGLSKLHKDNPFEEDVVYLVPAILGSEGKGAPFVKTGTCNLLVNNRCSVHDLDLKPVQGRMACCKIHRVYLDENGKEQELDERIPVLHTWNTQKGKDLIERWKKEVNFQSSGDDDSAPIPKTGLDLMMALFDLLGSHAKMYDEPTEEEGQLYDDSPMKTVTYVKNY